MVRDSVVGMLMFTVRNILCLIQIFLCSTNIELYRAPAALFTKCVRARHS